MLCWYRSSSRTDRCCNWVWNAILSVGKWRSIEPAASTASEERKSGAAVRRCRAVNTFSFRATHLLAMLRISTFKSGYGGRRLHSLATNCCLNINSLGRQSRMKTCARSCENDVKMFTHSGPTVTKGPPSRMALAFGTPRRT